MKYIIYMDVFFMVNLMMDMILLKAAAVYIKPQTTFVRCIAGAAVGSLLSCLALLLSYDNMLLHMLICYIFIAIAMVLVAYGKCSMNQVIKRVVGLYFVTILIGGAMNLVYSYTYFGYIVQGIISGIYQTPVNILRMCLFTGLAYVILRALMNYIDNLKSGSCLVMVKLCMNGKSVILKGLVDTGNSLNDPYYGKPVHIVEYEALQRILEGVDIHQEKYRLVPFHSLGKKNGLIEVIEFDEIIIWDSYSSDSEACEYEEKCGEAVVMYAENNPAIGLYHASLSSEKKYEVLLNGSVSRHKSQM